MFKPEHIPYILCAAKLRKSGHEIVSLIEQNESVLGFEYYDTCFDMMESYMYTLILAKNPKCFELVLILKTSSFLHAEYGMFVMIIKYGRWDILDAILALDIGLIGSFLNVVCHKRRFDVVDMIASSMSIRKMLHKTDYDPIVMQYALTHGYDRDVLLDWACCDDDVSAVQRIVAMGTPSLELVARMVHIKSPIARVLLDVDTLDPRCIEWAQKYCGIEDCVVCYEPVEHAATLSCGHEFCAPCIEYLICSGDVKCPLCRQQTLNTVKFHVKGLGHIS